MGWLIAKFQFLLSIKWELVLNLIAVRAKFRAGKSKIMRHLNKFNVRLTSDQRISNIILVVLSLLMTIIKNL